MRTRRIAREAAVQALYQCDTCNDWSAELVDLFFEQFIQVTESQHSAENTLFAKKAINGAINHLDFIDQLINESSIHWQVSRMSRVDRNILRLAVYEICFEPEIPSSVSINEGIELAKRFGADDSANFVNGVLDKAARTIATDPLRVESLESASSGLKLVSNAS